MSRRAASPPQAGSAEPALYRHVHAALRRQLAAGEPPVGASLPSEAELSRRFGVSRITIRHALDLLAAEGVIRKAKARRAVVAACEPPPAWLVESLGDIATMVGDARLAVLSWRRERLPEEARRLGLPAATRLPCLRGVLSRGGVAYARSIVCFPPEIGGALQRRHFDDAVVFRVMQRELGIRLADVEIEVSAERADATDAAQLGCAEGAPILVTRLHYRDEAGRLVEIAQSRGLAGATRFATRLRTARSRDP